MAKRVIDVILDAECPFCGSEWTDEYYTDVIAGMHQMVCRDCKCEFSVPIRYRVVPDDKG